jgi:NADP-dependent 3-hydroxy acid dehydrogenase YdfG
VRDRDQVVKAIESIPAKWKDIDVLINNAGLALGLSTFFNGNIDHWDTMIDTNVKGLLYVSRAISQGMIARKAGHIINIGSIAGKEVYANGNVYCASKHAVDALSKAMRIELAEYGVRVSAIHPGAVETEFSEVRFEGDTEKAAQVYKGFENLIAEDVADAVFYVGTRKARVNINDLIIMPQAQPIASVIHRK